MATKSGSTKKSATKKSSKKSSKKATKKPAKKGARKAAATFPFPNPLCIKACVERYHRCLQKGVNPALCQKRLQRCILRCVTGGGADPGPDNE